MCAELLRHLSSHLCARRHAAIVQPIFAFLVVRQHAENGIPELAGVLRIFQVGELVDNQVVDDLRRSHDALPVEIDFMFWCTARPMCAQFPDRNGRRRASYHFGKICYPLLNVRAAEGLIKFDEGFAPWTDIFDSE